MSDYSWVAVQSRTGQVITDLPALVCEKVGATLCDTWTGRASLPVSGASADWEQATKPWATYLVLLDGSNPDPVWGGWVVQRHRDQSGTVQLALASWEQYLARRYIHDLIYTGTEQCALLSHLVGQCVTNSAPPAYVPPALVVEFTAGSTLRDRTYESVSDKSVLSVMQELSGVEGGPEWCVVWRHMTSPERYVPVLRIADRIGAAPAAGLGPAATFELPGPVTEFSYIEDWSSEAAANNIVATSTADDTSGVRPQSSPHVYQDAERPTLEYRFSPSSSISNVATLDAHAAAALAVMRDGAQALTLTAARADAPVLGVDWSIGDDIGYRIASPAVNLQGTARAIAWEAATAGVETVTPILASTEEF